jgi:hypothetical protein
MAPPPAFHDATNTEVLPKITEVLTVTGDADVSIAINDEISVRTQTERMRWKKSLIPRSDTEPAHDLLALKQSDSTKKQDPFDSRVVRQNSAVQSS